MADCIRGFNVPCILCGDADGSVTVDLADVTLFSCKQCGNDFSADDVEKSVNNWRRVLEWIATCPERNDE